MANQPKKYKKFVATAATATLVASAIVPVASAAEFKDVAGNTHAEAINALADAGIINGYADGTFKPNQTINRGQVVKLLGRWLEAQGQEVPADWKTEQRFNDLPVTAEEELVKYAALAKDAGVFNGSNGNLNYTQSMQRQQMAVVLVRAINEIAGVDLIAAYKEAGFKSEISDLDKAYSAEQREAIVALEYAEITQVSNFNPANSVTRGQFASFLHRTIEMDVTVAADASIKAINNTTVEVTFDEEVTDVKALDFAIEGLEVSNAAVKQSNKKVVVLTTSPQTADVEYTVSLNDEKIGSFKGVSAVVPTKVTLSENAIQGVVGKQVTLKADIGVKAAGVPVTFNVKSSDRLTDDYVEEVLTDANGIATYSYTQYIAGSNDDVAVYPTGAPATRDVAKVFWGVDTILELKADDQKGNAINNGENKVYKVTYKDAKTGKPVADAKLNVTFKENVNVAVDKITKATVNGVNPYQLSNGDVQEVQVTTNSKGEATFTVTGSNTKATPVVFIDTVESNNKLNKKLDSSELQTSSEQLTIAAQQASHEITVTRDGGEEAAVGTDNGRKYKVVVKSKDGKVAAGEIVNIAFNEDIDRDINTNTKATFEQLTDDLAGDRTYSPGVRNQITLKLDSKGEGEFVVASTLENDYATPVAWLDINSSDAKDGKLDEGETFKLADKSYFVKAKLTSGSLKAYNGSTVVKEDKNFKGTETAKFVFGATNQSGKAVGTPVLKASYTVFNTGTNDVQVDDNGTWKTVSPSRSLTVSVTGSDNYILVKSINDKTTSVRVEANATTVPATNSNESAIYLGNYNAKASFLSTADIGTFYTGLVTAINTKDQEIQFVGKEFVSYKGATFTAANGNPLTQEAFEKHIQDQFATGKVSQVTLKKDGDKITVSIIKDGEAAPAVVQNQADVTAVVNSVVIPATAQQGATIALPTGSNGVTVNWVSNSTLLTIAGTNATVGTVTADENAVLTATFTKGSGADAAKVTKTYTVKLTPVKVPNVTKGQLLAKANAAQVKVDSGDYTTTTEQALQAVIYEAQAVLASSTPLQADLNKVATDLDDAVAELLTAVTATSNGLVITFAPVVSGANVNLDAIAASDVVASTVGASATTAYDAATKKLTVTFTDASVPALAANDTITVTVTVNGVQKALELKYVSSAWTLTGTTVTFQ